MNFSVVRSADTYWGGMFATELARHKRHLLLIGKDLSAMEALSREIRSSCRVKIHCFQVDDADTETIIRICDEINANFEVDFLLNYSEVKWSISLVDGSVYQLDKNLKASYLASPLFTHQLLPNLMLHANSCVLELGCASRNVSPVQELVSLFNASFSNIVSQEMTNSGFSVRFGQAELPWIDENFLDGSLAVFALTGLAEKILATSFPENFCVDELYAV